MPVSIRTMFVGQGPSLLPEDRFVNVFHFHSAIGSFSPAIVDEIEENVGFFYTAVRSGGNALGMHISPVVARAAKLISYDLTTAEPRVPIEHDITLPASVGTGLPEEVALVLSLHGPPPITARRRGRLYLGPLSSGVATFAGATSTTPSRPAEDSAGRVVQTLLAAAEQLMIDQQAAGVPWCIRSITPTENFVPITGGWVDNAFDTQRRRGPDATSRMTFE